MTSGASSVGRRTEVPMARCSERRDLAGSRVVARAIAGADHRDLTYHWILDAVENVWMQTVEDVRLAQSLCSALIDDVEPSVAAGGRELLEFLSTGKRP